jgi:dipeptidyl aminopeptidase/acylaminoacyl peptidase
MGPAAPSIAALVNRPKVDSWWGSLDLTPDGKEAVFAWHRGSTFEIHAVLVRDGVVRQLTRTPADRRSVQPVYSADGRRIAFLRDQNGDEQFEIWIMNADGSDEHVVTTGTFNRHGLAWAPDSRRLAYRSHETGELGISVVDVSTGQARSIVPRIRNPGADWITPKWSPDGRYIAYHASSERDVRDVLIHVVPSTGSGPPWTLATHPGRGRSIEPAWAPDGRSIAFTTDARGRFEVAVVPVRAGRAAGQVRFLTEGPWDESRPIWQPDGTAVLVHRTVESAVHLRRVVLATGIDEPIVEGVGVCYEAAAAGDGVVVYVWSSPSTPAQVFARAPGEERPRSLVGDASPSFDPGALVEPRHVWYPGLDGTRVPGLLYAPRSRSMDPPPALVYAHGGRTWQHLPQWDSSPTLGPLAQAFVSRGYAFLAPNVRGSRGYGRQFREANLDDWGGRDLDDLVAAADWLDAVGIADGRRIGVYGSSGGGYLALLALGRAPRRWAAGASTNGIISLESVYRHARAEMRGTLEAWIGSPADNPSLYRERSPSTYVGQIRVPVLILESGRDARLPAVDTRPFLDALRARRVAVAHHSYSNEGHDFHHSANRADAIARLLAFFDEHLVDRGSRARTS